MAITFSNYLNHLATANTFQPVARVELLNRDETPVSNGVFTGRILDGSLNVQRQNGVRRTCSLKLQNYDSTLNPSPDIFWGSQKFALYLGFKISGEDFLLKQGVFAISDPNLSFDGSNLVLNISGQDKWALLNAQLNGRLLGSTNILVGEDINNAVVQVLALPEINDPQTVITDPTTEVTFYDILARDKVASTVILDLGGMLSRNMYYDVNGSFNFRDDVDDTLKPSLYDFGASGDRFYRPGSISYPFSEVYNAVTVTSSNVNGGSYSYTAENRNDASPLSIDRYGYKVAQDIIDNNIGSSELIELRAKYELKQVSRLVSQIQFSSYPMFHLDVDHVCTVTDSGYNLDHEDVLINGFSINFGANPSMTINTTRTQDLLFDFN